MSQNIVNLKDFCNAYELSTIPFVIQIKCDLGGDENMSHRKINSLWIYGINIKTDY